jgi:hypothetical protein
MSIEVRRDRELLHVSGSVQTILIIPVRAGSNDNARFTLALSDGTLVEGHLDESDTCHFSVAVEGAGITRITGSRQPVLKHEWAIEWITISDADQVARAESQAAELPLFPDLAVEDAVIGFGRKM